VLDIGGGDKTHDSHRIWIWSPRVRAQLQSFAAAPPDHDRRWTSPLRWSSCCNSSTARPPSPTAPSHPLLFFHPPLLLPRLDISFCAPVMNELLLPSLSDGKQGKLLCLVPSVNEQQSATSNIHDRVRDSKQCRETTSSSAALQQP
jgi:hypothetical protein